MKKTSTRAGSHAGRGFRYQDSAAAWLALRCWSGELCYGGLIPEGLDDAELIGSSGNVFVQVKSRREHLGSYTQSDVAPHIRDLWNRAFAATLPPHQLFLVIERDIDSFNLQPNLITPLPELKPILNLLTKHKLASTWLTKTFVLFAPNPLESSVDILTQKLNCLPLIASVYFASIVDKVGNLSDDNGLRKADDFLSLSVSDIEREILKLAGTLSLSDLDPALQRGLCEPVDFLTPINTANFYLGVDVQPGHLAAGLLSERPEARSRVLNQLEKHRAALIAGPSGSGKSALMWESAQASRHTIRWFRIKNATEKDVAALIRLADSFRATEYMPIGFIVDDVGRNRSELWDLLATEAATRGNVLVLGSLREEDMFLVSRRSLATEMRESPDSKLAERIWHELKSRQQTNWPGWREPWQKCNGLLLEYTHLLTQDKRLREVLQDQISRRIREKRHAELGVLRIVSIVGQTGGTVDLISLQRVLNLNNDDLSEALQRLIDEHLIQEFNNKAGIGSLHQIRATAIADLTHAIPPPLKLETIKKALGCIIAEDIESFIAQTLAREPDLTDGILDGAIERIQNENELSIVAAIVRGLDTGCISNTVSRWLPHLDRLGIPQTQATLIAMFAVANTEPFIEEKLSTHFEAAQLLREMVHQDARQTLIDQLEPHFCKLLQPDTDWEVVTEFLSALPGLTLPKTLVDRLEELRPDLLSLPLATVIDLLETVSLIVPALAKNWVANTGQEALLQRLTNETPWISKVELIEESVGLAACADVYFISDRVVPDIHDYVVELCEKLFALVPSAELTISSAITPVGELTGISGFPIASKRIPRTNLPAEALPTRNRRWIAAVAQCVAPEGFSQYLSEAKKLLDDLLPLLEKIIDGIVRGKQKTQYFDKYLEKLGEIYDASRNLTRPPDPEVISGGQSGVGVSNLQNILHYCSTDLLRGLIELPDRSAASFMLATDVLTQIDKAKAEEPWELIDSGFPSSLLRLQEIIEQSRMIIGEAGFQNIKVSQIDQKLTKSARSNNVLRMLSLTVKGQIQRRLKVLNKKIEDKINEIGYQAKVDSRPVDQVSLTWPYAELLVVILLERIEGWLPALASLAEPLQELVGQGRRVTVIPSVAGFSFPDHAVSGISTLLPQPFLNNAWLENIGLSKREIPTMETFSLLVGALLEISTITAFGCAGEQRSAEETKVLLKAQTELELAKIKIESMLHASIRNEIMAFIDCLCEMGPNFSIEFWQQIHGGEITQAIATLNVVNILIIDNN